MLPETLSSMNSESAKPRIIRHPHGIAAVDAEYVHPGHAAVHIIQNNGRGAFVDSGTNYSVPYLLAALEEVGLTRDAVDFVFLTHVHLDHAGGAGLLMSALPNARLYVHPRGVQHMTDPSNLTAASQAVYGKEYFQRMYGDIQPIPRERIVSVQDNLDCDLGGRKLELIHTPGHALHHYAIVDRAHACIFAGDTFGISYRELDTPQGEFILPTTSPSQFDPEQLIASIDRMMAFHPESVYLMHFSRVRHPPRLAESLKSQIRELVRIVNESQSAADPHNAIKAAMLELWLGLLRRQGSTLPDADIARLLETDLELNAQGLLIWHQRQRRQNASA